MTTRLSITHWRTLSKFPPPVASDARTVERSFAIWRLRIRSIQEWNLQRSRRLILSARRAKERFFPLPPLPKKKNLFPLTKSLVLEHTIHTSRDSYKILSQTISKNTYTETKESSLLMQHRWKAENLTKMEKEWERKGRGEHRMSSICLRSATIAQLSRESNAIFANLMRIE